MDIGRTVNKYLVSDFFPNIVIHNILSICDRMASWETWDPRRVLGLHYLVDSRVVLIQCATLGLFMRWHRRWAYAGAGPTKQWVWAQRPRYSQCPPFSSTGELCSSSRGKILCFRTQSMENCRLLMRICSNASMKCDVPMVHSLRLLRLHL